MAAIVLASMPATAAAATPVFEPSVHRDRGEFPGDPLDLRTASLGQVGTHLSLTLRTRGEWRPAELGDDSLCVALKRREPLGDLCLSADAAGRPLVVFRRPAGGFAPVPGATVGHRGRVVRVHLYPHAIGLSPGRVTWSATSRWHGREDRLPDAGDAAARITAYGARRCFGAAARAGRAPCVNRALQRSAIPSPADAVLTPDAACRPAADAADYEPAEPCEFGDLYDGGPPQVALIGDSHAAHLRGAVDVAAHAAGWKAVSLTSPGCAFSTEVYAGASPDVRERCTGHSIQALRWLVTHPSVHVVIVSASAGLGLSPAGFRTVWSELPASVERIYVVRDVPRMRVDTAECVQAALRRRAVTTRVCAVPRDGALPADPEAEAAQGSAGRVQLVDLTPYFCDSARCFPVIGGVYAYRDVDHINAVFAPTLGPYLLRVLLVGEHDAAAPPLARDLRRVLGRYPATRGP